MESLVLIGLCIFVLIQPRLLLPTKILLLISILWVIYQIRQEQDVRIAKPLRIESLTPGTFISYSLQKILEHDLMFIASPRLVGERYMHLALVVDDHNQRKVIEWRLIHTEEFDPYRIESAAIGHIYSIPVEKYIDLMNRRRVVFRVFHPPRDMWLPFDMKTIREQKDKLLICTRFAFRYANSFLKENFSSRFYIPSFCMEELKTKGWREEYYIYK